MKPAQAWTPNTHIGRISGLKLSTLKQSTVYHAILQEKNTPELPKVLANLERIQEDMKNGITARPPSNDEIWKNLKHTKTVYRTQREFLFKAIKNIHKVGSYWNHIPDCEDRLKCTTCDKPDSMEHILTKCTVPGQREIWEEVGKTWNTKYNDWTVPLYGEILGCASARLAGNNKRINAGKTRLYQILISEAAYKIWSLRCKRVIHNNNDQEKWPRPPQIIQSLRKQIELRLRMDCIHTNEHKYKKKAIQKNLVVATWRDLLINEDSLPPDWISKPGVLVGIRWTEPHTA